mmetsp:Transcript_5349/g.8186  ORF Transcript_5349/g.8186 Transcript_5349/m.8186 type:complete len:202 (-) Transcript_5349:697-1302(-)
MRAEHIIIFVLVFLNGFHSHGSVCTSRKEVFSCLLELLTSEGDLSSRLESLHPTCQSGWVVSSKMVKISLEVTRNANVHRRTDSLSDVITMVFSLREEAVKNIILVSSYDEFSKWQSHTLGIVSSKNISKVSSRNRIVNCGDILVHISHTKVRPIVVGCLCKHTAPVDGVDCSKLYALSELLVGERCLDNILTIIKSSSVH